MRWSYKLPLRLRSLFREGRVGRELSVKLRFSPSAPVAASFCAGLPEAHNSSQPTSSSSISNMTNLKSSI
jgi:hypothetical protein